MKVIEDWVEIRSGAHAPTRIVATHAAGGRIDRSRPLCAHPEVARYTEPGSIDDAANFVCRRP